MLLQTINTSAKRNVNLQICLQVVDTIDMEDIGDKKAFCRCWKSGKVCFLTCYF